MEEPNEQVPGSDQTWAEVDAHENGPVIHAFAWLEGILTLGQYEGVWGLTDPVCRLNRARAWVWANRLHPSLDGRDRDELAESLATNPGSEPLWVHFAETEIAEYREFLAGWNLDRMGYASRPRPLTLDYELVVLAAEGTEHKVYTEPTPIHSLTFVMHNVDGRWLVAHPFGDTIPELWEWPDQ